MLLVKIFNLLCFIISLPMLNIISLLVKLCYTICNNFDIQTLAENSLTSYTESKYSSDEDISDLTLSSPADPPIKNPAGNGKLVLAPVSKYLQCLYLVFFLARIIIITFCYY